MIAYTVTSLAAEWHCSEGVIRKLIRDGKLGCFRPGTLIRISAEEVRRFECQNIPSSDSSGDTPSCSATEESEAAIGLSPLTALERKLRQGGFGRGGAVRTGPPSAGFGRGEKITLACRRYIT
jgi:excisionase family DNA binding protein